MTESRTSTPGTPVGEVLAGKFRVERKLGKGGMGVVLEATHLRLDERVAIKLLLRELADSPSTVERFMREARAASKIKSPHVVRVIDVDVLPDGAPYMVMERLEGFTLSQLSRSVGALEPAHVAAYIVQACDAIAEAHSLGIVHRDLKPSNLFLCRNRDGGTCVKVLDFGISKVGASLGGSEITQTDTLLGSPSYMSPEQLRSSREVDARTDIWSLGVVLYQCTTGTAPFQADTMPQVCVRVLAEEPDRPRSLRPDLPADFETIILRCLQKEPDGRYASVAELADALRPFATPSPVPWPDVTMEAGMTTASSRSALRAIRIEDPARRGRDGAGQGSDRDNAAPEALGLVATGRDSAEGAAGKTQETQGGWGNTRDQLARRTRRRWAALAVVGVAVVVGFVTAGLLVSSGPAQPAAGQASDAGLGSSAEPAAEASATASTEASAMASTGETSSDASHSPDAGAQGSASSTAAPSGSDAPEAKGPARPSSGSSRPARKPPSKATPVDPFGVSRQ